MSRDPRKDRARKRRLHRREAARWRRLQDEAPLLELWRELACPWCAGRGCSWPWGGHRECEHCGGQCYDHLHPMAPHAQAIAARLGVCWPELMLGPDDPGFEFESDLRSSPPPKWRWLTFGGAA